MAKELSPVVGLFFSVKLWLKGRIRSDELVKVL